MFPICFIYSSKFSRFLEIGRLRFSFLCPEERCRNCSRVTRGWVIDQPSKCKKVKTHDTSVFSNYTTLVAMLFAEHFLNEQRYFCCHCFNITMFTLQNEGQTALHIAAYEGDESMVKLLSTSNKLSADLQDNVSARIFL